MKELKVKLIVSFIAVLLSIALIAGASMAWMTISTNPEITGMSVSFHVGDTILISSDGGETYHDTVDLSDLLKDYSVLKPVSTLDLKTWFIPQYGDNGELLAPKEFIEDTTLEYANQPLLPDVTGLSDKEAELAILNFESKNYYAYCDIWLLCEDEDGCTVRMSIPHYADLEDAEGELNNFYGSYVLPKYEVYKDVEGEIMKDSGGNAIVGPVSNFAETAFRVGFLVYGDANNPNRSTGYSIYEPNADRRSNSERKDLHVPDANDYVYDYDFTLSTYKEGYYYKTKPIGVERTTVYTEYTEEAGVEAPDELYVLSGENYILLTEGNQADYPTESYIRYQKEIVRIVEPMELNTSRLIVQKQSSWDLESLREAILTDDVVDSTYLASMGRFLSPSQLYTKFGDTNFVSQTDVETLDDDIAGNNVILTLMPNKPVRVRVFFWIEGQDVDCWNDVSSGAFIVNIELAGKSL